MSEQQSLQSQQPSFLDIVREVIANPDVPVEKFKIMVDMQLQLEDRQSKREYDAAMIEAQNEIEALNWDKPGGSNNRYVSYPKIDRMLRPVRKAHGFSQSYDTEPGPTADIVILCSDVSHKGGHTRRYRTPMPIDPSGPKGGGVMTKPQAVNAGTSYGMRNLAKMIWNIPLLIDKDDIDGNAPREMVNAEQIAKLKKLAEETDSDVPNFVRYMLDLDDDAPDAECTLDKLPASFYENAVKAFERKREVIEKAAK